MNYSTSDKRMRAMIILVVCSVVPFVVPNKEEVLDMSSKIKRYAAINTHLQKSFDHLFSNFTSLSDSYKQKIVYMCDAGCQDDNRFEYGVTSAFLIAVLAEKKFVIQPTNSFSLTNFYEVRKYNWKLVLGEIIDRPGQYLLQPSDNVNVQESNKYQLELKLQTMDFSLPSGKDFILVSGENNWVQDLRRNPLTSNVMPWLYKAHACDVNRLVHAGLFQTPHVFYKNLTAHLQKEVGQNRLVCIHSEYKELVKKSTVLDFLRKIYHVHSNYKLFLSNIEPESLFDHHEQEEQIIINHVVNVNIDNLYKAFKYSDNKKHSFNRFRNFVNTHILKLCDVLVTTESAVGILSAHLRENSDGLFCYSKGMIYKCTRELIAGSFTGRKHEPVGVDYSKVRKLFG